MVDAERCFINDTQILRSSTESRMQQTNRKEIDHALQSADLRLMHFYARYLNEKYPQQTFGLVAKSSSIKSMRALLERYLDNYFLEIQQRTHINDLLCEAASRELLPLDSLIWIKENEDACIFCWGYLSQTHGAMNTLSPPGSYEQSLEPSGGYTPTTHEARYRAVLRFFDRPTGRPHAEKESLLSSLQDRWFHAEKELKKFKWLSEEDEESCRWAWEYLENYDRRERSRPTESNLSQRTATNSGVNSLSCFTPVSSKERLLSIYAVLRLWQCHPAEKTLLIRNMSKAWRQCQLRRERDDKKAINSYVDIEVKERLELLARHLRYPINELLSHLINKEFLVHEDAIRRHRKI